MKKIIKTNNKGITLVSLVVTVVVLLILASVTTFTGISTIKTSKLMKFEQNLKIIQAEVDALHEKNEDAEIGEELNNTEEENKVFSAVGIVNTENYRVFTTETLKQLGIEGIEGEYLVSIKDRSVISLQGFEYNDEIIYQLKDQNK